jgi:hypothetical protein
MTSAPPAGLLARMVPPVIDPLSSTAPVESSSSRVASLLSSAPVMAREPAATPSRSSELNEAVLKVPPRLSAPLSRSSVPEEAQVVLVLEVSETVPPAARRVPALFQLLPLNASVLPAVPEVAVPEKVPPVPMKMPPDCVPVSAMPVPTLSVLLLCQAVRSLLALSAPAKSMVPLPAMLRVVRPEAVLPRREVLEPVLARRTMAPASVSVPLDHTPVCEL